MNNVMQVKLDKMPDGNLIVYILMDDSKAGVFMKLGHFDPKSDHVSYLFPVPDDYKTEVEVE